MKIGLGFVQKTKQDTQPTRSTKPLKLQEEEDFWEGRQTPQQIRQKKTRETTKPKPKKRLGTKNTTDL